VVLMKSYTRILFRVIVSSLLILTSVATGLYAEPVDKMNMRERCPVCGMFVAKFDNFISQIHTQQGVVLFFDGVKDLLAYYFQPEAYGGQAKDSFPEIWVKDYYSLHWHNAREAFYVIGSDVYGPMGHELIPFSTRMAAESFLKDHKGEQVFAFDEITPDVVETLRSGQKMKH
ncbi:MAG: nitrous oxide reductase accessory protein NosL, partial [Proteobacteria bacterium]|nr:nitrous oxide reductase accessory protein NosL [Pseudomonadota bacterium]